MEVEDEAAAGAGERPDPDLVRLAEELSEGAVDSLPEGALAERLTKARGRPVRCG